MSGTGPHQHLIVLKRRSYVAERYLHGVSQYKIADETGVTQGQIFQDLQVIRKEWLNSMLRDFDALKSEELAKIDALEAEAWKAWHLSLQPHTVRTREKVLGGEHVLGDGSTLPKAPVTKVVRRREVRIGDPRYLERIQKCIDQRCAILGLLAPIDVNERLTIVVEDRTRQANERLLRLRQAALDVQAS